MSFDRMQKLARNAPTGRLEKTAEVDNAALYGTGTGLATGAALATAKPQEMAQRGAVALFKKIDSGYDKLTDADLERLSKEYGVEMKRGLSAKGEEKGIRAQAGKGGITLGPEASEATLRHEMGHLADKGRMPIPNEPGLARTGVKLRNEAVANFNAIRSGGLSQVPHAASAMSTYLAGAARRHPLLAAAVTAPTVGAGVYGVSKVAADAMGSEVEKITKVAFDSEDLASGAAYGVMGLGGAGLAQTLSKSVARGLDTRRDPGVYRSYVNASPEVNYKVAHSALEELAKIAEARGHWRRLPVDHVGHDESGNKVRGKTWVTKSRLKPSMKPMEHQRRFTEAAKQRLGRKGGGGILAAHGTGTGKTFSAINAFEELKEEGKARRALVVTPAGLRNNFLEKGVNKFTDSKGVIMKKPAAVDPSVEYIVVSYEAFRNDPEGWIEKLKPDTLIVDEVQRASNPDSKTHQALMWARKQVPNFMGLTASISQNDPSDVVPLVSLAEKGEQQIKSKGQFKKEHIKKEPSAQRGVFGGKTYEKKLVRTAQLNARIGASIHYVEDLDASKKPVKDVEKVEVPMSKEQINYYRMSMKGVDPVVLKKIKEGKEVSQRQAMNIFMQLMRARQVSNSLHIASPNMTLEQAAEATPKIKRVLDDAADHIKKVPDAQVIMYTNMVHGGVDVLTAGLKARGIPFGVFAGTGVKGVTNETRQQAVEKYLGGENKVIVITGAGAEGLSLGNTTMVQLVDGHYNPERMAQAEARGVRAGGLSHRPAEERRVNVRRYVSALPKTFWQTVTFQPPERSVGQFVYLTAERKDRLNKQLREILKSRSDHETRKRESKLYRWFGGGP